MPSTSPHPFEIVCRFSWIAHTDGLLIKNTLDALDCTSFDPARVPESPRIRFRHPAHASI